MQSTDVVIVGAGIAGLGFAWCAAPHRRVIILEQGGQPLAEASAQNAGMLRRFALSAVERRRACRTRELIDALAADLPTAERPLRATGAIIALARPDPRYAAAADDLRRSGIGVDELDLDRLGRIAPALRGSPLAQAFHLPDDGLCDAWTLGQLLLNDIRAHGAQLRTDTRVTGLRYVDRRVVGVDTDDGPIAADLVVIAAGAWAEPLARAAGLPTPALQPKGRHLLRSAEHPLADRDHPWCWIDDVGLYLRPEAGGFLLSPCDEVDLRPSPGPGSARTPTDFGRALAADKIARWLPALGPVRARDGWIGLRTFKPDTRQPHIAAHPGGGLVWLAGLGGAGLSCGLALAEEAASVAGIDGGPRSSAV